MKLFMYVQFLLYPNATQINWTRFQYKVTEIKDNVVEMCYVIDTGQ